MPPRNLPTMPARAGGMESVKTRGLTHGTTRSRGLRALSEKRRRTRVAKPRSWAPAAIGRVVAAAWLGVTVTDAVISKLLRIQKSSAGLLRRPGGRRGAAGTRRREDSGARPPRG